MEKATTATCAHLMLWTITKLGQQVSSSLPCPCVNTILDEQGVNDLTIQSRDEGKLGLVLSIFLGLLEDLWGKMTLQRWRRLGLAVQRVLADAA